ncbi:unnamed protein product [Didymodactylos carnosus]|uniref:PARP catalytic domain-containing protein n=1 Tax=Didymodactylos carnosus TaxID=1234261 RepID=A0A814VYS9_9BILA|nr:unnamed protein product [Didymodactylos carnosus]CAF3958652.1 unnamed protein product [Didymodactylos carnosus]
MVRRLGHKAKYFIGKTQFGFRKGCILSTSPGEHFTNQGAQIGKLPDFGSLPMSKAVLSALTHNRCGRDLIVLSSILSVLNSSVILKSIPDEYAHVIKRALRRYTNLEKALSLSDDFRELAQLQSGKWELIAKALLAGYSDKVYVSLKILQGKTQQFLKYNFATSQSPSNETVAVIDISSKLRTKNKGPSPASLVLARDVLYLTTVRSTAILSFVGQIESLWIEYTIVRELPLNENEERKLNDDNILSNANKQFSHIHIHISNKTLILRGPSGEVLNAELYIRQQLVTEFKCTLSSVITGQVNDALARNLTLVTKMRTDLFGPLRWRWEAQHQVKIRTKNNHTNGTVDITVEGLDSQNQLVHKEFQSFLKWLRNCVVIRNPDSAVPPRMLKPQVRKEYADMEEKISHVTNKDRSPVDIWKSLQGPTATRETRMEVVAWVAVCEFKCRLEGGFVRDWIVGNYSTTPANLSPKQWIVYQPGTSMPMLNKQLVPSDLDCHLPASEYFDIERFSDRMHKFKISIKVFRQDWRYVLLLDEDYKTGPFTMDLIEPHIALTHDRIDFDVSNLSLEKDYTRELGMRVNITSGSHPIQLEQIVDNIRNKRFQVLRPIEGEQGVASPGAISERIDKMKARGWTQLDEVLSFVPDPPTTYNAVLVPFPSSTTLYQNLVTEMRKIPGSNVISIEQIKNPDIEALYEYMKRTISKECPGNDPNERELFHGTKGVAIDGIFNRGFDD